MIEGSANEFVNPMQRGNYTKPESLKATVRAWRVRYGVDFIFIPIRSRAARGALAWLDARRQEWNEGLWQRSKADPFVLTVWDFFKKRYKYKAVE